MFGLITYATDTILSLKSLCFGVTKSTEGLAYFKYFICILLTSYNLGSILKETAFGLYQFQSFKYLNKNIYLNI